ncbi:MAG: hypothetical protein KKD01_01425 [Proteobacteria bacterium]|nr:hypothetical protein [Pseudomonadota bacterium]MBU1417147.1 hypothetical protein [Pseudomonadota bacterium]MBU1453360.1 hypothetical protein [Pseudomonadota bacterium]
MVKYAQDAVVAGNFNDFELNSRSKVEVIEYDLIGGDGIADLTLQLTQIELLIDNAGVVCVILYDYYAQEKVRRILNLILKFL